MGTPLNPARFSGPGNFVNVTLTSIGQVFTLLPANPSRKYLRIELNNPSNNEGPVYITFDGSTPSATNGIAMYSGTLNTAAPVEFGTSFVPTGEVKAVAASTTVPAYISIIWA